MLNKVLDIVDGVLNFIMIVFCVLLVLVGGYAIYDSYRIYDDSSLDDTILRLSPKHDEEFKLAELQAINPDIEGWVSIFNTSIDYPVLHSENNLDYLNQDYDGEYSTGGSIFSDYRNSKYFDDDFTIIYGHNMTSGQMFSDIKDYESSDYFDQHLYGVLFTKNKLYKLDIMYFAKVNAFHDNIYNLITFANGENKQIVDIVQNKAINVNFVNDPVKLLLLSTCDSYGSNDRTVLLASLTDTDEEEINRIKEQADANVKVDVGANGYFREYLFGKNFASLMMIIILLAIAVYLGKKCYKHQTTKKS